MTIGQELTKDLRAVAHDVLSRTTTVSGAADTVKATEILHAALVAVANYTRDEPTAGAEQQEIIDRLEPIVAALAEAITAVTNLRARKGALDDLLFKRRSTMTTAIHERGLEHTPSHAARTYRALADGVLDPQFAAAYRRMADALDNERRS